LERSVSIETEGLLDDGIHIDDSIVKVNHDGRTIVLISNQSNSPCVLECGRDIARASEVNVDVKTLDKSPGKASTTEALTSSRPENTSSTEVIPPQHPEQVEDRLLTHCQMAQSVLMNMPSGDNNNYKRCS